MAAGHHGRHLGVHWSVLVVRRAPCLGIEAEHQPEYQDDQPEQRAEHDDCAHGRTPSRMASILKIVHAILKVVNRRERFEE